MPDSNPVERRIRIELKRTPRSGLVLPGQPPAEDFYDVYIDGDLTFRYESMLHLVVAHFAMSEEIKRMEALRSIIVKLYAPGCGTILTPEEVEGCDELVARARKEVGE
jgi:hypothetical protein